MSNITNKSKVIGEQESTTKCQKLHIPNQPHAKQYSATKPGLRIAKKRLKRFIFLHPEQQQRIIMKQYHLHNRPDRELTKKSDLNRILNEGKFAVISMCRENEPYIVSLSYGYDSESNALYFHSSKKGLKMDFLKSNKNVCATVINDKGYVIDECKHKYESVVFWGEMQTVTDMHEKKHGMKILLHQLEDKDSVIKEKMLKSDEFYSKMEILKLKIEQIHGKARQ